MKMNRRMQIGATTAALMLGFGAAQAQAAALLEWNFAQDFDETTASVGQTSRDGSVSDSTLARGAGLIGDPNNNSNGAFVSKAQHSATNTSYSSDIDTAMSNGQYLTFTVDSPGNYVSIDSIIVDNFVARSPQTFNHLLFSSVGGFTAGDELASGATGGDLNWVADQDHKNLLGTIEFRLLTIANSSTTIYIENGFGTRGDGLPDLQVNGSTSAIPEPASLALLGLAGLLTLRRRQA